jgi:PKD repeat protein
VELVVTVSIVAASFLALSFVLAGALGAYGAARSRTSFTGIANAELESLRALAYDDVGVRPTDPDYGTAYPGDVFEGRDAVQVTSPAAPAAVSLVATGPAGLPVPYTIRRWVTWTDASSGTGHVFKRLEVRVEWHDRGTTPSVSLESIRYPGNQGPLAGGSNTGPGAVLDVTAEAPLLVGSMVSVDAVGSVDADGDPLSYAWDFGDGSAPLAGASTASHVYSLAGAYTIQLTVSDGRGGVAIALEKVTVVGTGDNLAPAAVFTETPGSGTGPLTVNFDASGSSDPDGGDDLASYSWNWGDGSPDGTGINASHVFTVVSEPAVYTVTLSVTDKGGLSSTASGTVSVSPLTCTVSDGSFRNPEANAVENDVTVSNSGKPVHTSFTLFASTNSACTSVTGRLTHSSGTLSVPLVLQSDVGGVKTWRGTGVVGGATKFSTGLSQSAEIRAPVATGETVFTFPFGVHQ